MENPTFLAINIRKFVAGGGHVSAHDEPNNYLIFTGASDFEHAGQLITAVMQHTFSQNHYSIPGFTSTSNPSTRLPVACSNVTLSKLQDKFPKASIKILGSTDELAKQFSGLVQYRLYEAQSKLAILRSSMRSLVNL